MNKNMKRMFLWVSALLMIVATSCDKENYADLPLVGHWGCEQYISCRTDGDGNEKWDTLRFEVGSGKGYEVFLNADGSGRLMLNDSPALIKEFKCNFRYDTISNTLTLYNTLWIISIYSGDTTADLDIEEMTENRVTASWINYFSEPEPFFERFFLKRIDD